MDKNREFGNLKKVAHESDDLLDMLDEVGMAKPVTAYKGTLSPEMLKRYLAIHNYLKEGYTLVKILNAFPVIRTNSGRSIGLNIRASPPGFSWIAFFFPFAVCTQISEWSYFYVMGIISVLGSIASSMVKVDLSSGVNLAVSLCYGIYFPYLRYIAVQKEVKEIPIGKSIIYGLLLAVLSGMPSLVLDSILGVS